MSGLPLPSEITSRATLGAGQHMEEPRRPGPSRPLKDEHGAIPRNGPLLTALNAGHNVTERPNAGGGDRNRERGEEV
eukprot:3918873-Pyramimonas_sp.AAC.1